MVTQAGELLLMSTGKRADNRHPLQRAIPSQHLENLEIPLSPSYEIYFQFTTMSIRVKLFGSLCLLVLGGYKTSLHGVILLKCKIEI